MAIAATIPINVKKERKIPGHEHLDWQDVPTKLKVPLKDVVRAVGATSLKDLKPGQYSAIAHRGGSDKWPENTKEAIRYAYFELGVRVIEIDVSIDKKYVIFIFHDKRTDRWLRRKANFRKTAISKWPREDWQYYDTKVKDGKLDMNDRTPVRQYIFPISELPELKKEMPDLELVKDCRDDEPPIVTAQLSHIPELWDWIYIQVLNFGKKTRHAKHFIKDVWRWEPHEDWLKNLMFIISPNPGAFHLLAGVKEHSVTVKNALEACWTFMSSFPEEGVRVYGFHTPQTSAGKFWLSDEEAYHEQFGTVTRKPNRDLITNKINGIIGKAKANFPYLEHRIPDVPKLPSWITGRIAWLLNAAARYPALARRIPNTPDLTPFITDKIARELLTRGVEKYPHITPISPCAFTTWTNEEGISYHMSFHRNLNLVRQREDTNPAHYFFREASKPETHFEAGVRCLVTDDVPNAVWYLVEKGLLDYLVFDESCSTDASSQVDEKKNELCI